ncbi:phosphate acyltransferase PlsX [bacterium]|nr:phosphate acyltransferase PlsX [bacterium]
MKIAVDASGEEPGHQVVIDGVLNSLEEVQRSEESFKVVLYGHEGQLRARLDELGYKNPNLNIVHAPDIITMDDRPREALELKQKSSIVMALQDLAAGVVSAFVSMGNTGAIVGGSRAFLGRTRWISKPALGVPLPRSNGMGFMLDAGATSDPKPNHLVQFAAMGSAFVETVYNVANPKVGLLNIGIEAHKGDELVRDVYKLLVRSPLNFIGNIEGGDLFNNKVDVIVTSGFVGNILLKFTESIPALVMERVNDPSVLTNLRDSMKHLDYGKWGGATLLGVERPVVIGHGRSKAAAVSRAVLWAHEMVKQNMTTVLRDVVFKVRRALWLSNPFSRGDSSEDIE